MSNSLMAGKRGLIMGLANDKSIAWGIAKSLADAGAELAFSYQGEALKKRVGPLAEQLGSDIVLPCDVSDEASIDELFDGLKERWDNLDFIVHAIGFSDKKRTSRSLCRHIARELPDVHGYLGLQLYSRDAAR